MDRIAQLFYCRLEGTRQIKGRFTLGGIEIGRRAEHMLFGGREDLHSGHWGVSFSWNETP